MLQTPCENFGSFSLTEVAIGRKGCGCCGLRERTGEGPGYTPGIAF